MRYLMFLLVLMFANMAQALECQKLPDCESLGYSTVPDPNCAENGYMYCPFDQNYKVCVQYNCKALGFTESDKTSWCADLIKCKGNQNMTLCQKPCFASNYEELKDLAELSKCQLITMKKDITIPLNQGIKLADNTTLDGGGHTLSTSANQASLTMLYLPGNNKIKNLKFSHHHTQNHENYNLMNSVHKTYLENVEIDIVSESTTGNRTRLFTGSSSYEISGNFKVNINSPKIAWAFSIDPLYFKNANFDINLETANADVFYRQGSSFENSTGKVFYKGGAFSHAGVPMNFTNSKITFEHVNFYSGSGVTYSDWTLHEGSEIRINGLDSDKNGTFPIKLNGTAKNPAKIIFGKVGKSLAVQISAHNTTDTVVYNGVSYHPTTSATTTLTDIPASTNWTSN